MNEVEKSAFEFFRCSTSFLIDKKGFHKQCQKLAKKVQMMYTNEVS